MTPSELKYKVQDTESHFFDRKTMRFFGDSMRNYGVRSASIVSDYDDAGNYAPNGFPVEVWELYRKKPVKHGLRDSAYFRKSNFSQCFSKRG